jgi:phosphatidylglycerophosphatase A
MKNFLDRLAEFIATGFGSGLAPKAPGTFGSAAALPLIWVFHQDQWSALEIIFWIFIISLVGLWSTARTERIWSLHDDPRIVVDEFAGMFVTLAWFPFDVPHVVGGFLLFRLFDIWKPGPVGYIDEHGPGAFGTFFDDIVAGIFAASVLYLLGHIIG